MPENWILAEATPPQPVENRQLDQILQTSEGDVEIVFANSGRKTQFKVTEYDKKSVSFLQRSSSCNNIPYKRNKEENIIDDNIQFRGLKDSNQSIPHSIYEEKSEGGSPTTTNMNYVVQ